MDLTILQVEWTEVLKAPKLFGLALLVAFGLAYKLLHWRHGRELDHKKSELEAIKTQLSIAEKKSKEKEQLREGEMPALAGGGSDGYPAAKSKPVGSLWAGRVDVEFLLAQQRLWILFKDGHSFFEDRYDVLKKRLSQPDKTTAILILHPDYAYMEAVANMDPHKAGQGRLQKEDCQNAVQRMWELRSLIQKPGGLDISRTVTFAGYHQVPTWTGFIGDDRAFVHLYPTSAYRGKLQTLYLEHVDDPEHSGDAFDWYRTDFAELLRITRSIHPVDSNLWNYEKYLRGE